MPIFNLLLFIITLLAGSVPLWFKGLNDRSMNLLLAFSGSFLLSITFLHLLHETFEELHATAGLYLLTGFFLQLIIQRFTHGIEHGHVHTDGHDHHVPLGSILAGLGLHAFMEGLPLGFNYTEEATGPSLYLAVAAHKLPEIILATTLVLGIKGRQQALLTLVIFSLLTPAGSMLASLMSQKYSFMMQVRTILIPVVAGSFIHIATTIFFESGTKQHLLTRQKVFAILLGVGIGLLSLFFE
ncbi:MAG TPA: ZIP family metal transporter [Flavipsychrobacter sp.]|nr:ZIP family metal transporter [Flavipsychrobacter sp.]